MARAAAVDAGRWAVIALGLAPAFIILLIVAVLVRLNGSDGEPRAELRGAKALEELPGRPKDIEAHAALARSVLPPADARAQNAAISFAAGDLAVARPFVFKGSDEDRSRALECLSTAILYEAGDDTAGEAAVAQVVLNRVRHPAFPGSICGVVFQGAQRTTGCQFTFTCDGSLRRQMSDAAWRRAREVAGRALAGHVDATVGLATHYHTDWVYPYWSPSLNKLARVGTHLFFGWPGSWGGPRAFNRTYRGREDKSLLPGREELAALSAATVDPDLDPPGILGLSLPPAKLPAGMGKVPLYGNKLRIVRPDGKAFGLLAPADAASAKLVNAALALCAEPGPCQVLAWSNEDDVPGAYPIPDGARGTTVFEYERSVSGGEGSLRFDCERFPNKDPKRCFPASRRRPPELAGVRWKNG